MDLTPDVLRGIEFRRKGRGYDADEVDAYRQKVEIWVGEAQARLREATSKLDEAETRAREAEERSRTNVESDVTIQRTLLLAQRTADAAVAEAEETAGRKVAEAEAEAEQLVTEARNHRERAIAEAESEVREAIDLKRAELLDELTTLERVRDTLTGDVAALESHIESQHRRVQDARDVLGVLLDEPGALAPVAAPEISGVGVPEPATSTELLPEPEDEVAADDELELETESEPPAAADVLPEPLVSELVDEVDEEDVVQPVDEDDVVDGDPWAEPEAAATESVLGETPGPAETADDDWSTVSEDAWADTPPPPPPPPPDLEIDESTWADAPPPPPPPPPDFDAPAESAAPPVGTATFGGLSGPAVPEQLPELDERAEEANPWLAELSDKETGGEGGDRSRFGRRR